MIPTQHSEHLSKAFYALTIDPLKDILCYFTPFIGAWLRGCSPLVIDQSQRAMLSSTRTEFVIKEIEVLTTKFDITRSITPCVSLYHYISSFGGRYSISQPVLMIPHQALYTPSDPEDIWVCSNNEVRFLLARELAHINMNNSLLRIAIKTAVVSAIIFVFSNPMNGTLATYILIAALATYLFSERTFQSSSDLRAIDILKKRNIANASDIAVKTLEKIQQQNLYFRENSLIAKAYISKLGNNYLDLLHPTLTSRIKRIKNEEIPRLAGA